MLKYDKNTSTERYFLAVPIYRKGTDNWQGDCIIKPSGGMGIRIESIDGCGPTQYGTIVKDMPKWAKDHTIVREEQTLICYYFFISADVVRSMITAYGWDYLNAYVVNLNSVRELDGKRPLVAIIELSRFEITTYCGSLGIEGELSVSNHYRQFAYAFPEDSIKLDPLMCDELRVNTITNIETPTVTGYANLATAIDNTSIQTITEPKLPEKGINMNLTFNNLFADIKFGKAPSTFGLSFDNHICYRGKYFDGKALNDSCGLTLDLDGLLYIMPVQKLEPGDIVVKSNDALYYSGDDVYVSLTTGQVAEYVPVKVLNMTFYSVVRNLAGNLFGATSKDNPMSNMLPFLLLGKDNTSDDLIKFMLLSQGGFNLFGTPTKE